MSVALHFAKESHWQSNLSNSFPVSRHHCLVGHEFQQRAALTEFINSFFKVQEGRPLLESTWQFATPEIKQFAMSNSVIQRGIYSTARKLEHLYSTF